MITRKYLFATIITGSLILLGGNKANAQLKSHVDSAVTRKVFEHHMMAFRKGDVDETLKEMGESTWQN